MVFSEEFCCPFGDSWTHYSSPGENPAPEVPAWWSCLSLFAVVFSLDLMAVAPSHISVRPRAPARLSSQREERQRQAKNYKLTSPEVFRETLYSMKETAAIKNVIYELLPRTS